MYDFTKQYEARILVRGRPVTEYHHTDGNIYVEGRKGSDYSLEFINNGAERICVLPAVVNVRYWPKADTHRTENWQMAGVGVRMRS